MAYSYALISDEEAKRALKQESASSPLVDHINDALYAASEEIQNYLERHVVKLSTHHWIEYHERDRVEPSILRVKHWPIDTSWGSLEINEDSYRDYGSGTILTSGTDYIIVSEGDQTSKIIRISGDSTMSWESGLEAIRITLKGGWAQADMPPPVKRVAREYLARQYHAAVNQEYAFQRVDDARGSVTHYGPVMLTKPMLRALDPYKDHGASTCVRYTEEADSP